MGETAFLIRSSRRGRVTLAALTLGSGIAILDGSVVNVALRHIGTDLGASIGQLQWVVTGYLLALAALVLAGGGLGDRFGRRRIYLLGMTIFLLASIGCALAPTIGLLITIRVVQGVGGALLTPGALAIIQSSFAPTDRAPAIGTWAGVSGLAGAAGPFIGGWLVDHASWRWVFGINVPLCVLVIALARWAAPESRAPRSQSQEGGSQEGGSEEGGFDVAGASLTALALGALTFAFTGAREFSPMLTAATILLAVGALTAYVLLERRTTNPLVPAFLWSVRVFTAANLMTLLVYGALGAVMFVLVLQLQVSAGWSALAAGLSGLPVTIALLLLSSRAAALSARIGPRVPMSVGPALCALGVLALVGVGAGSGWTAVLPGMTLFALGLALLVAPLTATVLAAVPDAYAGTASGVNNAVARAGSLLAVAALPVLGGLSGDAYRDPVAMTHAHRVSMLVCAVLLGLGALVSWVGLHPDRADGAS